MSEKKVFVGDIGKRRKKIKLQGYTHIRGYHACRPTDVASYCKGGIRALTKSELKHSATAVFGEKITDILNDEDFKGNIGKKPEAHFCIFKSALLSHSGHYLCYGSEYLICIAKCLDNGDYGIHRQMLLNVGIPTIFACDVPIDYIAERQLEGIISAYQLYRDSACFWIYQNLPADYIVAHEHPSEMYDPYYNISRGNSLTDCTLCHG